MPFLTKPLQVTWLLDSQYLTPHTTDFAWDGANFLTFAPFEVEVLIFVEIIDVKLLL